MKWWKVLEHKTKKAFTLAELIIVIIILAILWTIAFIFLQWYSIDARDVKRITDVRGLLDKINIEVAKGMKLGDSMANGFQTWITINSSGAETNIWIVNFENLKENQESFQDPLNGKDYPFAFSEWYTEVNWEEKKYKFMQMAITMERDKTTQFVWNYFQYQPGDSPNLFTDSEWNYLTPIEEDSSMTHPMLPWPVNVVSI
jgi:prepilin-type N-terminal cleavage/methylation domain-containing protein